MFIGPWWTQCIPSCSPFVATLCGAWRRRWPRCRSVCAGCAARQDGTRADAGAGGRTHTCAFIHTNTRIHVYTPVHTHARACRAVLAKGLGAEDAMTAVGDLVFMRFVAPAIVYPVRVPALLPTHPRLHTRPQSMLRRLLPNPCNHTRLHPRVHTRSMCLRTHIHMLRLACPYAYAADGESAWLGAGAIWDHHRHARLAASAPQPYPGQ
jgi:hypothetical protein